MRFFGNFYYNYYINDNEAKKGNAMKVTKIVLLLAGMLVPLAVRANSTVTAEEQEKVRSALFAFNEKLLSDFFEEGIMPSKEDINEFISLYITKPNRPFAGNFESTIKFLVNKNIPLTQAQKDNLIKYGLATGDWAGFFAHQQRLGK